MKKSIAKKWVAALRSGEYVQGKGRLVSDKDEFCCLGVLCNLAVDAEIGEWKEAREGHWYFSTPTGGDSELLPQSVQAWAGLGTSSGTVYKVDGRFKLTGLNDDGKSFTEIADIIEANWEAL